MSALRVPWHLAHVKARERGRGKDSHQWFSGCLDAFTHGYCFFPLSDKTLRNSLNSPRHCSPEGRPTLQLLNTGRYFRQPLSARCLCPACNEGARELGPSLPAAFFHESSKG